MRRKAACFLALTCALALPATAQDWPTVEFMAGGLGNADATKAYGAAIAACLAGQGDAAQTAEIFTDGGWSLTPQPEMGVNEFASADENLYALAADDGSFCAAYSETLGTDAALGAVQIIAGAAGFDLERLEMPEDCIALSLNPGPQAEIMSSGNDPACSSETTSSVRFIFAGGQ